MPMQRKYGFLATLYKFQGVESTPNVLFCQGSTPRNLQLASRKEEACLYTE
jgi:hypothetical protein